MNIKNVINPIISCIEKILTNKRLPKLNGLAKKCPSELPIVIIYCEYKRNTKVIKFKLTYFNDALRIVLNFSTSSV